MFFKKEKPSRYTSAEQTEFCEDPRIYNLPTLTEDEEAKIQEKFRRKAFKKKAKVLGWIID